MAPDIPWQVFAWLVTGILGVGMSIIGWAVWRGNQTARMETLSKSLEIHMAHDERVGETVANRLEQVGNILGTIQQQQAVIMDRLGIPGPRGG